MFWEHLSFDTWLSSMDIYIDITELCLQKENEKMW